jgi:hypothetical protein
MWQRLKQNLLVLMQSNFDTGNLGNLLRKQQLCCNDKWRGLLVYGAESRASDSSQSSHRYGFLSSYSTTRMSLLEQSSKQVRTRGKQVSSRCVLEANTCCGTACKQTSTLTLPLVCHNGWLARRLCIYQDMYSWILQYWALCTAVIQTASNDIQLSNAQHWYEDGKLVDIRLRAGREPLRSSEAATTVFSVCVYTAADDHIVQHKQQVLSSLLRCIHTQSGY